MEKAEGKREKGELRELRQKAKLFSLLPYPFCLVSITFSAPC
jgi:hypothetical protein